MGIYFPFTLIGTSIVNSLHGMHTPDGGVKYYYVVKLQILFLIDTYSVYYLFFYFLYFSHARISS